MYQIQGSCFCDSITRKMSGPDRFIVVDMHLLPWLDLSDEVIPMSISTGSRADGVVLPGNKDRVIGTTHCPSISWK